MSGFNFEWFRYRSLFVCWRNPQVWISFFSVYIVCFGLWHEFRFGENISNFCFALKYIIVEFWNVFLNYHHYIILSESMQSISQYLQDNRLLKRSLTPNDQVVLSNISIYLSPKTTPSSTLKVKVTLKWLSNGLGMIRQRDTRRTILDNR